MANKNTGYYVYGIRLVLRTQDIMSMAYDWFLEQNVRSRMYGAECKNTTSPFFWNKQYKEKYCILP